MLVQRAAVSDFRLLESQFRHPLSSPWSSARRWLVGSNRLRLVVRVESGRDRSKAVETGRGWLASLQ